MSEDRSCHKYIVYQILTQLHIKSEQHLGPTLSIFLFINSVLFADYVCPFPRNLASQNFTRKKDDKVGNKNGYKTKGNGKN